MTSNIKWEKMPRGSEVTHVGKIEIGLWKTGDGYWRWTAMNMETFIYLGSGKSKNKDQSRKDSIILASINNMD